MIEFKYHSVNAFLCLYFSTLSYKLYNKINNEPVTKYPGHTPYPNDLEAISFINERISWPGYRCVKLLNYHCNNWFSTEMTYGGFIIEYTEPDVPDPVTATYIVFRGTKTNGEVGEDINFTYSSPDWLIPDSSLMPVLPIPIPAPGTNTQTGVCSREPGQCLDCDCPDSSVPCPPKPCVFSGFNRMYTHTPIIVNADGREIYGESVRQQVLDYIIRNPIQNLFITGHSLGGALATLLGADIKFNYNKLSREVGGLYSVSKNSARIYTFAGPSCGNVDFYKIYSNEMHGDSNYTGLFSIVNNRDPVPTLPEYLGYAPPPPQKFCFTSTICGVDAHKTPTYTRYLIQNWELFDSGAERNCGGIDSPCGLDCKTELIPPIL